MLRKRLLGQAHPATLVVEAAPADVLDGIERYEESALMYNHVPGGFEKIYGPKYYEIAVNVWL
jgi:hypothetical protein